MLDTGWIKIHRKMQNNPVVMKDADHLAIWIYLLMNATYDEYETMFGGQKITLAPGQLITGRKKISDQLNVPESKVKRVLSEFKSDHQIDQQGKPYGSLITILSWDKYQLNDQQNGQQMDNKWTTNGQRATNKVDTIKRKIKESKERKNIRNNYSSSYEDVDEEFQSALNEWRRERGLI